MVPGCYVLRLYGSWSLRLRRVRGSGVQLGLIEMLNGENDKMVRPVIVLYKAGEDVQGWTATVHETYFDCVLVLICTYCTVLCYNIGLL
jgi:hypothetical protein